MKKTTTTAQKGFFYYLFYLLFLSGFNFISLFAIWSVVNLLNPNFKNELGNFLLEKSSVTVIMWYAGLTGGASAISSLIKKLNEKEK